MIRLHFDDGTHEDRPANSPVLYRLRRTTDPATLPDLRDVVQLRPWYEGGPAWNLVCHGDQTLDECARAAHAAYRRGEAVHAWRITGQGPETKALTGRWVLCGVETVDEQIARLTRERDAAEGRANALAAATDPGKAVEWAAKVARLTAERDAEKARAARWKQAARRLRWWAQDEARGAAHLRRGAQAMLAVLRPGEDTNWKPSTIAADLVVWAEHVAELAARADAAEKRLADLRAWAEEIANGQSETAEGRRVAGDFRAVVYRIDDKEAP